MGQKHEPVLPPPPPPVATGPGAPQVTQPNTNGKAVASLVLGILWLFWIGSVLALIFGYQARGEIDSSNGKQSGRGQATAGIVLGWIGVGWLGVTIFLGLIGAVSGSGTPR